MLLRRLDTDEIARATSGHIRPVQSTDAPSTQFNDQTNNETVLFENETLDLTLTECDRNADENEDVGEFLAAHSATLSSPLAKRKRNSQSRDKALIAAPTVTMLTKSSDTISQKNISISKQHAEMEADNDFMSRETVDSGFMSRETANIFSESDKQSKDTRKSSRIRRTLSSETFIISDADSTFRDTRPHVRTPETVNPQPYQCDRFSYCGCSESAPYLERFNVSNVDVNDERNINEYFIPLKSPISSISPIRGRTVRNRQLQFFGSDHSTVVSRNGSMPHISNNHTGIRSNETATCCRSMSDQSNIQSHATTRNRLTVLSSSSSGVPIRSTSTIPSIQSPLNRIYRSISSGSVMQTRHAQAPKGPLISSFRSSASIRQPNALLKNVLTTQCSRKGSFIRPANKSQVLLGVNRQSPIRNSTISDEIQEFLDNLSMTGSIEKRPDHHSIGQQSLREPIIDHGHTHTGWAEILDDDESVIQDCISVTDSLTVNIPRQSQNILDTQYSDSEFGVDDVCELPQKTQFGRVNDSGAVRPNSVQYIEESDDSVVFVEPAKSITSQNSLNFRISLFRHSRANTPVSFNHQSSMESLNLEPPTATQINKSNWLLHKSCSNNSVEEIDSQNSESTNKNDKPRIKCFPMSSRIVYSDFVAFKSIMLAVNHFIKSDRHILFYLVGKFQRYEYLNSNFNGVIFTTASLSMTNNKIIFIVHDRVQLINRSCFFRALIGTVSSC